MVGVEKEIELKFTVEADELKGIRTAPVLRKLAVDRATTRTLRSIYFDTLDHALRRARTSLRVRRVGGQWIQTVKIRNTLVGGLSQALEIEAPVDHPVPEPKLAGKKAYALIKAAVKKKPLKPVFETVVRRTTRILADEDGNEIEVAIDAGEIRLADDSLPLTELELELKAGTVDALYDVAKQVLNGHPFRFSEHNKAERGYRAVAGQGETALIPRKNGGLKIGSKDTVEESLTSILHSCLDQIVHNRQVVLVNDDPEGLHQLRVGLRRLRSALKVFGPVLGRKATARLEQEARWAAVAAGELRDIDVLIADIVEPPKSTAPADVPFDALIEKLVAQRDVVKRNVIEHLSSARMNDLIIDLAAYVEGRHWQGYKKGRARKKRAAATKAFAPVALDKRWKTVARQMKRFDRLTIEQRHDLRKDLKKLRYTLEYFVDLYSQKKCQAFLKSMKKLQNAFGYLNDVVLADHLTELAGNDARLMYAAAYCMGWHHARADFAMDHVTELWAPVSNARKFWH